MGLSINMFPSQETGMPLLRKTAKLRKNPYTTFLQLPKQRLECHWWGRENLDFTAETVHDLLQFSKLSPLCDGLVSHCFNKVTRAFTHLLILYKTSYGYTYLKIKRKKKKAYIFTCACTHQRDCTRFPDINETRRRGRNETAYNKK